VHHVIKKTKYKTNLLYVLSVGIMGHTMMVLLSLMAFEHLVVSHLVQLQGIIDAAIVAASYITNSA
jgi:hypothetical protein